MNITPNEVKNILATFGQGGTPRSMATRWEEQVTPTAPTASADRNYLAYHNEADDSVTSAVLTRDEWDARMFDLFNMPTVDRIWSADPTDGVCRFEWVRGNELEYDEFAVIHNDLRYTFVWEDGTETVFCRTTGESFGPRDPFGQVRWSSARMAVQWTLDNIERITDPR